MAASFNLTDLCTSSAAFSGLTRNMPESFSKKLSCLHSQAPISRSMAKCSPQLQVASSSQEIETVFQVFSEDKEGIICYQTKTGEIVCEGMDEGPHFYPASSLSEESQLQNKPSSATLPALGELLYEI